MCFASFVAVFTVLAFLAITMRLIMVIFPEKEKKIILMQAEKHQDCQGHKVDKYKQELACQVCHSIALFFEFIV